MCSSNCFPFFRSLTALKGRWMHLKRGASKQIMDFDVLCFPAIHWDRAEALEPPGIPPQLRRATDLFLHLLFSRPVGIVIAGLLGFSASAPISASYDDSPLHSAWRWLLMREFRGISDLSLRLGRDGILGVQCALRFSGSHTHAHTQHTSHDSTHSCKASFWIDMQFFFFFPRGWALALGRARGWHIRPRHSPSEQALDLRGMAASLEGRLLAPLIGCVRAISDLLIVSGAHACSLPRQKI